MQQSRRDILKAVSTVPVSLGVLSGFAAGADCSSIQEWDPNATYDGSTKVVYEGVLYQSEWWTRGNEPDASKNVWTKLGDCDSDGGDDDDGGDGSAPTARISVSPAAPEPGTTVTFDGGESTDSDGTITDYAWDIDADGSTDLTGETVSHTFDTEGTHSVALTVTDDTGATDTATTTVTVDASPDEFKVIGYYPGWKATPEQDYYPADVPWSKLTDVKYAFLGVDADAAEPTIMSEQDESNLAAFRDLKAGPAADTRIHVSIGGWADSTGFSEIAATESTRQSFAQRAVEIVREYNLDGVDIDWEHPGSQQGLCQCGSNTDYETHIALLEALRSELDAASAEDGKRYWLSIANGGSDWNAGGLRHGEIGEICDYAMIMSYDFTGSWMDVAGLNAPLNGDGHPTENSQYGETYHAQYYAEYSVDKLWAGDHGETGYWPGQWEYPPAPPAAYDELVLGLPFYGRGFNGTELYGSYSGLPEGTWHHTLEDGADPTGAFDFGDLEENYIGTAGWERKFHEPGNVPYLVNTEENTLISYDDEESIATKVAFAKERGMQGVMFWDLAQDWNETLLDTIVETI